jgi:ribosomal protein L37E
MSYETLSMKRLSCSDCGFVLSNRWVFLDGRCCSHGKEMAGSCGFGKIQVYARVDGLGGAIMLFGQLGMMVVA